MVLDQYRRASWLALHLHRPGMLGLAALMVRCADVFAMELFGGDREGVS